jgi:hypothetical protein
MKQFCAVISVYRETTDIFATISLRRIKAKLSTIRCIAAD